MGFEYDFDRVEKAREHYCANRISSEIVFRIGCTAYVGNARSQWAESLRKLQAEHTCREHAEVFDDLAATGERLRAVKANPPFH
jgi:hypothetical protein